MIFFVLLCVVYPVRINADHLYDVGVVIDKQLENLKTGNSETIIENIKHYNKLLEARIENVRSQDPRLLPAPREFVTKGKPLFVLSIDLPKLEKKYEWDNVKSKSFMDLIQHSINLWSELESELNKVGSV